MAKHSGDKKRVATKIDDLRRRAVEDLFGLKEKVQKHIEWSLNSTKLCSFCSLSPEGQLVPGRIKNDAGVCRYCEGSGVVPDAVQRNWAVQQINPIITPSPKTVEFEDRTNEDMNELERELHKLDNETFSTRFAFLEDIGNGTGQGKNIKPTA